MSKYVKNSGKDSGFIDLCRTFAAKFDFMTLKFDYKLLFILFSISFCAHMKASTDSIASYEGWITASFDYLEADSIDMAAEALKRALRIEPGNQQNGLLLSNLGTLQRRMGQLKEAEESYTIGLGFLPGNTQLLTNRASLYAEMEEYGKAIADYSDLLVKQPKDEDLLYERALCRLMAGDTVGARSDLEFIDSFNPQSAKSRLGMAMVYKAEGLYQMAVELYDALMKRNPENARLLRERAEVYYLCGRMGAALNDINQSIRLAPHEPLGYILRAQIRLAKGDREYGRRDMNQAIELGLPKEEAEALTQKYGDK